MKTIALIITLIAHTLGLWPHLSAHSRARLTSAVSTGSFRPAPPPISVQTGPLPVQTGSEPLHLDAASAMAVDLATGTPLFEQNATAKRPIASITKLATALVVLSRHQPSDQVKIPKLPAYDRPTSWWACKPGETYTVGDLVRAALINSGDDAADALALSDAGSGVQICERHEHQDGRVGDHRRPLLQPQRAQRPG